MEDAVEIYMLRGSPPPSPAPHGYVDDFFFSFLGRKWVSGWGIEYRRETTVDTKQPKNCRASRRITRLFFSFSFLSITLTVPVQLTGAWACYNYDIHQVPEAGYISRPTSKTKTNWHQQQCCSRPIFVDSYTNGVWKPLQYTSILFITQQTLLAVEQ